MSDAAIESGSASVTNELPLDSIIPNPHQPRTDFDDAGITELAASIKKDGLLQPIVVRPDGKNYQIIAGERRWQACRTLEMKTVPVKIMEADEVRTLELALIENLQRTNLNAIEEARGYKALINASNMTQGQLAETVSKSRAAITNALRLLDLPEEVQEYLYEGKITAGHARAILAVPDEDRRIKLANKVVENKLSVRDTENMAKLFSTQQDIETAHRVSAPRSFKTVARKLRQQLETPVRVKNSRGKNRIEIEFKDEEDLVRIFSLLSEKQEGEVAETANEGGE